MLPVPVYLVQHLFSVYQVQLPVCPLYAVPSIEPALAAKHCGLCALQQVQEQPAPTGPRGSEAAAWPAHFIHDVKG